MDNTGKCFIKVSEIVTRNIAGETIVVPVKGRVGDMDSIYTLNEVGTLIWRLVDDRASVNQMVDAVTEEYDVGPVEAERDVFEFLGSLEEAGLIKTAGA